MNKYGDKIIGITLIISALLFLLSELGYLPNFEFGTVVAGVIFGGIGIAGIYQRNFSQAIFSFSFCYIFTYEALSMPRISFLALMVIATLLSIGVSLLFPQKTKKEKVLYQDISDDVSITFGGVEKYISSNRFEEANIHCTFGEVKVYFDQTTMLMNEATVNIKVTCGEVNLFVPRSWKVESSVKTLFGDVSKTGIIDDQVYTLYVKGSITCSELQIIYI